jgi:hypothetical protein
VKKYNVLIIVLVLILCFYPIFAFENKDYIVRVTVSEHDDVYDISTTYTVIDARENYVDLLTTKEEIEVLKREGYTIQIRGTVSEQFEEINRLPDRGKYHTYNEMVTVLNNLVSSYPSITELDTIGYSVQGRLLLALKITDNPNLNENEPEFRINGCHHGNEWPASEIPIYLAQYLCENYGSIDTVTNLVDNREIWIIPMLNPDGHEVQSRTNANGIDLNRNYGYMWIGEGGDVVQYGQPESRAMYEFSQRHNFVLGLSYHTYGEIVNYIWNWTPTRTPDDSIIVELSNAYASYNGYSVTNGYDWYRTNGDMNDYSYGIDGAIDWTIELATTFIPDSSQLDSIWDQNRPAIISLLQKCKQGISGVVRDSSTKDTLTQAVVNIEEVDWPVFCDPVSGHFHRILQPGTYTVRAWANGYYPKNITNVTVTSDTSTHIIVDLDSGGGNFAYKYAVANIPDTLSNPTHNITLTPWSLGPVDGRFTSIGKDGEVIYDMGYLTPIVDDTGEDFTIYEGDDGNPDEGFYVYVSNDYKGPWTLIANGSGTDSFDISSFGTSARYVRIVDDGDGILTEPTPGFDVEAIEGKCIEGVFLVLEDYYTEDSLTGNNNGIFDPGETVQLFVSFYNAGHQNAVNVTGELSTSDPYVIVDSSTSNFGDIQPGNSGNNSSNPFVISSSSSTPHGHIVILTLAVSEEGGYTDNFSLNVKIGAGGDFLIWDNDPNQTSGDVIRTALEFIGYFGNYTTDLSLYYNELQHYLAVFVCCGIYPDNNTIEDGGMDATALENYITGGGRMYLEGGDVWYYDPQHGGYDFCPLFGINATDDGSDDLATVQGQSGTFTTGMSFTYSGENNWIDHISPTGRGFLIFENSSPSYDCGVANDAGTYRTVGVSWEFGGLVNGSPPSTKEALADSIMNFFGIYVDSEEKAIDTLEIPTVYALYQNYPNPTNKVSIIEYHLPVKSHVSLQIYDVSGRLVDVLVDGEVESGFHKIRLNTKKYASGIYFYRLIAGDKIFTRKMTIIK